MSEPDHRSPGPDADRTDRPADASPPVPIDAEARPVGLADQARAADLVADVTLAQGVTYTPAGLRVLRTSYVFRVDEVVSGGEVGEFVTVDDTGGVYPDGSTVSTENSFRLVPGQRYVIFAKRVGESLWLRRILQVHDGGAVTADASGRVLTAITDGVPTTEPTPTFDALRYVRPTVAAPPPMDPAPDGRSEPLPEPGGSASADAGATGRVGLDALLAELRGPGDVPRAGEPPPEGGPAPNIEGRSQEPGDQARGRLSGNYVTGFQSHYHYMPDDDNWAWTSHCRGSWNTLVGNNLGLFAFKIRTSDGQPIRDRLPVANDQQNNVGVLTSAQMTTGGYDTWETLSANGVCYTWTDGNRVRETDILINPAIAGDEAQFRKSLTHEFGHALTLQHEDRRMALLYPGTFRQPPNYASLWYSRQDDMFAVRSMLDWVNANIAAGTWDVTRFTDMATWSQAHDNPGTTGNLVMTRMSPETVARGATATMQSVHVENRGNVPAANVRLTFYLSTNEIVSTSDIAIGTFTWGTFSHWWSGSLTVRIPSTVAPGRYFVGWSLATDTAELSASNNTALLLRDRTASFAPVRVTIT